ncbi:hypothetical protein AC93_0967 [Escherichia coli 2-005-03_S4_C2]|nr:hypothetical protein AD23_0981 [Escherichia coli 2-005-03_S4_C3]EZJ53720.1 hypothetical protein AC93_0967 [Escherichia coli 2-005-03_S4_C2]KDT29247.1 hypothetical protein AC67_0953 [Escherichia coli 2-052-05_S4_C1]
MEYRVHCRTGSLESLQPLIESFTHVHCRTGSLENKAIDAVPAIEVHCRTGSLEMMHHKREG